METVANQPIDAELHLLTDWSDPGAGARHRKAAIATVAIHVAVVVILFSLPENVLEGPRQALERTITPLIEPPSELTQKAPNRSKVTAEFEVRSSPERPRVEMPQAPPAAPHEKLRPLVMPPAPAVKPAAPVPLPEAPKIDTTKAPPKPELPQFAQVQPQIQVAEQPKLTVEDAGRAAPPGQVTGRVPMPRSSVSEAIQDAARGGGPGGRLVVGDPGASDPFVFGGIRQSPTPGVPGANVELKSDPMGVDFRPYLMQVLAAVRRNWTAVMPESVKMGLRGHVSIQFAIGKTGSVLKLVYAEQSGTRPLDEAAVAGISASNPFPPLPTDFKGERIVVQLNFAYNMPRR
ncbi:MAG: TonB family protein [Bryobacteraceae bacterium]|jgi:TonB family protein